MKGIKKIALLILGLAIIPCLLLCSACDDNGQKKESEQSIQTEHIEEIKSDFNSKMNGLRNDIYNLGYLGGDGVKCRFSVSQSSIDSNNYVLYSFSDKNYVVNEETGKLVVEYVAGDEPDWVITSDKCDEYFDRLFNCEIAYYKGYTISLKTGVWTANQPLGGTIEYTNGIYFYETYFDYLFRREFSIIRRNVGYAEIINKDTAKFSEFSYLDLDIDRFYSIDDETKIIYRNSGNGLALDFIPDSLNELIINENVTWLYPESFAGKRLDSITIDSAFVLLFFSQHGYTGYESMINNISRATDIIYLKNGLSINSDSPFFDKYEEVVSDKTGYAKYQYKNQ